MRDRTTATDIREAFIGAALPFAFCEVKQKAEGLRTYGFVYYFNLEDATAAVQKMDGAWRRGRGGAGPAVDERRRV